MIPIIAIPVYNDKEGLQRNIESIYNSTTHPFDLIIIESESTDGSAEYVDELVKNYPDIGVIHTKKEGPMKAMNLAFKIALERKQDLYFTQTDAVHYKMFDQDWLLKYVCLAMHEDCGILTCWGGGDYAHDNYVDGFYWIAGHSTYIPLKTIERLGGYDENFEIGWGADIEYTYRIVNAGLRIYFIDYWVYHHRNTHHLNDRRSNINEIDERNSEYFRRKYNLDKTN
jgi:GT2 family glycosyltransferase